MDAPGWDQLVSGEINSPLTVANVQNAQADVPLKAAQTQLTSANAGEATARTQLANVQLPAQTVASQMALQNLYHQQIATAASEIDPNDPDAAQKWKDSFQKLADDGNPDALQHAKTPWNPAYQQRVIQTWSSPTPAAATAAMSADPLAAYGAGASSPAGRGTAAAADAGGLGAGLPDAVDPAQLQHMIDGLSPAQLTAVTGTISKYQAAMQRVISSSNPQAQWNQEALALGHPDQVGQSWQMGVSSMEHQLRPIQQVLQGRQTLSEAGLPAPAQERNLKEVGGALYDVDPFGKPGTALSPVTPVGQQILVGTDDQGRGIYHNSVTGAETVGTTKLNAKPGTTGSGSSVYALKQQAWLDVHPGDTQGALDYAAGRGKTMSAPEMVQSANAQATREYQAIYGSGITPPPPEGPAVWIQNKAQEDMQALASANTYSPPAAGGGGGGGGGGPRAAGPRAAAQPTGLVDATTYGDDTIGRSRATVRNDWVQASRGGNPRAVQGVQAAAMRLPPMTDPGPSPPASATAGWRPGQLYVTRANGAWTVRDGKPVRLW